MKFTFKDILTGIGERATEAYRQSLIDNDRVATGKTKNSIKYEVNGNTVKVVGASHIMDLEHGKDAAAIAAEGAGLTQQIEEWMSARGIWSGALRAIMRSLQANGWNTSRKNRTNPNGGTKGIITDVTEKVYKDAVEEISIASKELIKKEVKDGFSNFK